MYEYKLKNTDGCKDGDFVVCKITWHVEKEGSGNEDDGSGSSSDAASNSVEKTRVLTMSEIPLCYKFCPTEIELVDFYLTPKAKGLALPDGHQILEKTLFGEKAAPPWEAFNDKDPWQYIDGTMDKKIIYVFTNVNVNVNKRKVRVAGCGKWHEEGAAKPIRDIADKRLFQFKPKKKIENKTSGKWSGKWTMREYMLNNTDDCKDGNFVVCRISYQVEKEGSGSDNDGSGSSSDAASNSVEKTSKKKEQRNKRVRRGGVSTDQMVNQESGQVSTELRLSNQEIDFPCRGLSQQAENDKSGSSSAAASDSVEKTSKTKGNKRVRRGRVSTDQMGNQESGQVSAELRLSNQEIDFPCRGLSQQHENQEVVPHPAATPQEDTYSSDTNGRSTPILHDCFRGLSQQDENQEVVPHPAAIPQDTYSSDTNERSTPILHDFFK